MKLRARLNQKLECPYCRGQLNGDETRRCERCGVSLHEDCAQANGGCVTLGCSAATKPWPNCRHCHRPLHERQSTVCLHCGLDHRSGQHIPRSPSLIWMTPWRRWIAQSNQPHDRHGRGKILRWKIATALLVLGAIFSFILKNSGNPSLEVLNLIFIPCWGATLITFFLSRA